MDVMIMEIDPNSKYFKNKDLLIGTVLSQVTLGSFHAGKGVINAGFLIATGYSNVKGCVIGISSNVKQI